MTSEEKKYVLELAREIREERKKKEKQNEEAPSGSTSSNVLPVV